MNDRDLIQRTTNVLTAVKDRVQSLSPDGRSARMGSVPQEQDAHDFDALLERRRQSALFHRAAMVHAQMTSDDDFTGNGTPFPNRAGALDGFTAHNTGAWFTPLST
jgi:hypothetical protein